jgi:hypothetical protein
MISTLRSKYNYLLTPLSLAKKDDPSVLTIECTIGQKIFHKTFYDVGSGVNIMSNVNYEYSFGNKPLYLIYMQLQNGGLINSIPRGHSERHYGQDSRSLCPH